MKKTAKVRVTRLVLDPYLLKVTNVEMILRICYNIYVSDKENRSTYVCLKIMTHYLKIVTFGL